MLDLQERERSLPFHRKCLFCKSESHSRTEYFQHMLDEHGFHVGHPDNLVQVNVFLDTLEKRMGTGNCVYCQKEFPSRLVLRKHMRKKKHFKIAPTDTVYDRFYIANYLEPGRNCQVVLGEEESDKEEYVKHDIDILQRSLV